MDIKIITECQQFLSLKESWQQIFEASGSRNIFLSWEWCFNWWKHFGKDKKLNIIIVEDDSTIVGIAPLMVVDGNFTTFWKPVIQFIGTGLADYMDVIILRDNKAVLSEILNYLEKEVNWGKLHFRNILEDSPNLQIIEQVNLGYPVSTNITCVSPYIRIRNSWDEYYKSLSRGFRRGLKSALNRITKSGEVNFKRYERCPEQSVLNRLYEIHNQSQVTKVGKSILESQTAQNFFSTIASEFGEKGWLDVSVLEFDGNIISYVFGFKYEGTVYYWNLAHDSIYQDFSPGKVLLAYLIEDSFAKGFKEFDFMIGDETYKLRWATDQRKNFEISVYSNPLFYYIEAFKRTIREKLVAVKKRSKFLENLWIRFSKVVTSNKV